MAIFQVRFHRYNRSTSESRISGVTHINAKGFSEAYARAHDMLNGMRGALPECDFEICHLLTYDYRGLDCEGGIQMWETADEMSDRIEAQNAA